MFSSSKRLAKWLGASAALCLAGGCAATPGGIGSVPVKPSVATVDPAVDTNGPQFTNPDGPINPLPAHDQLPDDVQRQIDEYTRRLPKSQAVGNGYPPQAAGIDRNSAVADRSSLSTPQPRHSYDEPRRPAVSSDPGEARPPKMAIPPESVDPGATARAITLRTAAGSQPLITQPEIVPEGDELKTARTAGGAIPAGNDAGPLDPNASLEDRIRRRAHDFPHDTLAQLDWELYCTLKEDSLGGLPSVAGLPDKDRELVSSLVDGIRDFRSTLATDRDPMFEKEIGPLLAMADRLRSQAELQVPVVAICRKVVAYGDYEPMDVDRLPAGKDTKIIVYCEVENCVPERDSRGMWQTHLMQHTALYSDTGTEMWADSAREINDTCRNRRRDFFLRNMVTLPQSLPPGKYTMKVTVEDVNANKFNEGYTQLTILAPPAPVKPAVPTHTAGPLVWPGQEDTAGSQYETLPLTPR